ncbi:hypothetical protein, partial [Paracoccus sp. SY]|uniref:hypothetical protein n=1 Tax=Paracoccus sp. SY TaxID=1330255 RepID=UPI001960A491
KVVQSRLIIAAVMTPLIRTVTDDICLDFILFANNGEEFDTDNPVESGMSWFIKSVLTPLLGFSISFFFSLIFISTLLRFISRTR